MGIFIDLWLLCVLGLVYWIVVNFLLLNRNNFNVL